MKKIAVSPRRKTREFITNPHNREDINKRIVKSKCIDYRNNAVITELGNGYSKITAINTLKRMK